MSDLEALGASIILAVIIFVVAFLAAFGAGLALKLLGIW